MTELRTAEKLLAFAWLLEYEQVERMRQEHLDCEANLLNCKTAIKMGEKWARVDVGYSGKYMVAMEGNPKKAVKQGEIVGIKAYGVPHPGHRYGTLDDIHQWNWGGYVAFQEGIPPGVVRWEDARGVPTGLEV